MDMIDIAVALSNAQAYTDSFGASGTTLKPLLIINEATFDQAKAETHQVGDWYLIGADFTAAGTAYSKGTGIIYYGTGANDFHIVEFFKQETVGSATLEEDVVSSVEEGAIKINDKFEKGTTFTQFVKRFLIKEVAPVVAITSTLPYTTKTNGVLYEKGDTQTATLTVKVYKKNATDGDITKVTLAATPADANYDMVDTTPNATTNTYTKNVTMSETTVFKGTGLNANNKTGSSSIKFTFVNATYWGVLPEATTISTITEADIKTMTKELIDIDSITSDKEKFNATKEKLCIVYPKEYGLLSSAKDILNGFELITAFDQSTITMTEVSGSVDYYVYLGQTRSTVTDFEIELKW